MFCLRYLSTRIIRLCTLSRIRKSNVNIGNSMSKLFDDSENFPIKKSLGNLFTELDRKSRKKSRHFESTIIGIPNRSIAKSSTRRKSFYIQLSILSTGKVNEFFRMISTHLIRLVLVSCIYGNISKNDINRKINDEFGE